MINIVFVSELGTNRKADMCARGALPKNYVSQ